jgi:hypothetical protein
MDEGVGVWAMELTHVIAEYMDLYTNDRANDLNNFDNMDCACGTHPTAYTKMQLGWLDPSAIAIDSAPAAAYNLHSIGPVPAPPGRYSAVQIQTTGNPLFAEARQRVDQYDGGNWWNNVGISSEGVIIYELAGVEDPHAPPGETDPLIRLITQVALMPGQSVTSSLGVRVQVTAALAGGFKVAIDNPTVVIVPDLYALSPGKAATKLETIGLLPKFVGPTQDHPWVSSQTPGDGTSVPRGSIVTMVLKTGPLP